DCLVAARFDPGDDLALARYARSGAPRGPCRSDLLVRAAFAADVPALAIHVASRMAVLGFAAGGKCAHYPALPRHELARSARRHSPLGGGLAVLRQQDPRQQAALGPVFQLQAAAMHLRRGAGEGEAKTRAAGLATARRLDPVKGFLDLAEFGLGNAGTAVGHLDRQALAEIADSDLRRAAIFDAIFDQIADRAAQ